MPSASQLDREARRRLDVEALSEPQAQAVQALADGRDVLVVVPTGGGKSAIYQLAGALIAGTTIVVSPLIALQQDQVAHIEEDIILPVNAPPLFDFLNDAARNDVAWS